MLRISGSLVLIVVLGIWFCSNGQAVLKPCPPQRHFEFFSLVGKRVRWPDSELAGLLGSEYAKPYEKTNFLIPPLVLQINEFDPKCQTADDVARLEKLLAIYLQIRSIPSGRISQLSIGDRVEFVRRDFDQQVSDDTLLPKMIATFDDGPLYGKDLAKSPKGKGVDAPTNFGKMSFFRLGDGIAVAAFTRKNTLLWAKRLTGTVPERYLQKFSEPIEVTSSETATVVSLFVDGEKLCLYTRPDGRFIFYSHSW